MYKILGITFFSLALASCTVDSATQESLGFSNKPIPVQIGNGSDGDAPLPIGEEVELSWDVVIGQPSTVMIEVSFDGGKTWEILEQEIVNDGNFKWSTPRIPGAQARLRVLNVEGQVVLAETPSIQFAGEVDTFAPSVPSLIDFAENTYTGATSYTVNWTPAQDVGDAGLKDKEAYQVKLYSNGTCQGDPIETVFTENPSYSFSNLTHGSFYSVQVQAQDWVGNLSEAFCSPSVEIDIHVPTVSATKSGSNSGFTNSRTVALGLGNDTSAELWCITEDIAYTPQASTEPCPGGVGSLNGWSSTPPSIYQLSAGDGEKKIHTWVADSEGEVLNNRPGVETIVLDTEAPGVPSITGVSGNNESTPDQYLGGQNPRVHLPDSNGVGFYDVEIVLDSNGSTVCESKTIALPVVEVFFEDCNLTDGTAYRVRSVARDLAGNSHNLPDYLFNVDNVSPSSFSISTITGGTDSVNDGWLGTNTPVITYTDATGESKYVIEVRDQNNGLVCQQELENQNILTHDYSASPANTCESMVSGEVYKVLVTAKDDAGNGTLADNAPVSVTADVDGPDVTLSPDVGTATTLNHAAFTFTTADPHSGIASVECQLNGGGYAACVSPQNFTGLAESSHTFNIRVTDNVGLTTTSTHTWAVDLTPPNLSITSQPAALSNNPNMSVAFSATDLTLEKYECELNWQGFSQCSSPFLQTLTQGSHRVAIRAYDELGRGDEEVITFAVDLTNPTTSFGTVPTSINNKTSETFTFTASDLGGAAVARTECQINGGGFSTCTSPYNPAGLTQQTQTVDIRAVDTAGNVGTPQTHSWITDLTGPTVTTTSRPATQVDQTSAAFVFTLADTGGSTPQSTECQVDGGGYSSCSSPVNLSSLSHGNHQIDIRATDAVGNVGAVTSESWAVDLDNPVLTLSSQPSSISNDVNPSVGFSATDFTGIDHYQCELNGGGFSNCTSPQGYTVAQGSHTISVRAFDQFGRSHTQQSNFVVDTTQPTTNITADPGAISDATASFSFSSSDTGGGSVAQNQCQVNGGGFSTCTSPHGETLGTGNHTFEVRAIDSAGNTGPADSFNWQVDATNPTASISSSGVGDSTPTFNFSGSDSGGSGLSLQQCQLDGVEGWTTCTSGKTYSGIGSGSYIFRVRSVDGVGNVGSQATKSWSNGGWSGYGSWGSCSAACGGGTRYRYRSCNSPSPSGGGYGCSGSNSQAQSCNTHACSQTFNVNSTSGCVNGYCSCVTSGQLWVGNQAKANAICVYKGFNRASSFSTTAGPVGQKQCNASGSSCYTNANPGNVVCSSVTCTNL